MFHFHPRPGQPSPWRQRGKIHVHFIVWYSTRVTNDIQCVSGSLQQLRGAPAHSFGGRDESFCPARVFGIKLCDRCCTLRGEQLQMCHCMQHFRQLDNKRTQFSRVLVNKMKLLYSKLALQCNYYKSDKRRTHPASLHDVFLQVSRSCHQHVNSLERNRNTEWRGITEVNRNIFQKWKRLLTFIRSEQDPRILRGNRNKHIAGENMKQRSLKL